MCDMGRLLLMLVTSLYEGHQMSWNKLEFVLASSRHCAPVDRRELAAPATFKIEIHRERKVAARVKPHVEVLQSR